MLLTMVATAGPSGGGSTGVPARGRALLPAAADREQAEGSGAAGQRRREVELRGGLEDVAGEGDGDRGEADPRGGAAARPQERDEEAGHVSQLEGEYLVGESLSIADIAVVTSFVHLRHVDIAPDPKRWPKLRGFAERVASRPSFQT